MSQNSDPVKKQGKAEIRVTVSAKVLGEVKPEDLSKGVAYAFSKGGRLLGRTTLNPQGVAAIDVRMASVKNAQSLRVIIGPEVKDEEVTSSELLRRGGEEVAVRIEPGISKIDVNVPVISDHILCWLLSACFVSGTVLKKIVSGGISMDLPVCGATVEVYEVDPIPVLIPKLPDEIIERLREIIINPPPPPPPPDPEPFTLISPGGHIPTPPQPLILGDRSVAEHAMGAKMVQMREEHSRFNQFEGALTESKSLAAKAMVGEFGSLSVLARSTNTTQFRQVLIDHAPLVKHIFCLIPIHVTFDMDLVATTKTDDCGKFKTLFFRGCHNPDTPDLYFKVKQKMAFFPPVTVYAPTPISCYTFWNYRCGTQEVTLHVSHPLAITCPPCPNYNAPQNWVLFMAIGNLPLSRIRGTSLSLSGTTSAINLGLTENDAPFGELLRPRIEFDNSLRDDLGVKYYQVSYRKGTSGSFTPLTALQGNDIINRHYTHEVGGDLIIEPYKLGPVDPSTIPSGLPNLFEIPPGLPPIGQWSIPDAVEDTASAKFQTLTEAPLQGEGEAWLKSGIYQFKLDLFNDAGNLVDVDALNIKFRVPTSLDFSGTINTEDAANPIFINGSSDPGAGLVRDDDADGKKSMIISVYVDNSRCKAEIPAPTVDGIPASDDCGVISYDVNSPSTVVIKYRPVHPLGVGTKGFATYNFSFYRGNNQLTLPPKIPDSGDTPIPPSTLSTTHLVTDILGSCPAAAFAEYLYVAAKGITGWRRLAEYDSHAVRAFAIAPSST